METGLIFDIQGHSVHDGPGCRTLVFLSGCPLRCGWCSNPEGQLLKPQLMFRPQKCVHRHYRCVEACPHGAIRKDALPQFNRALCNQCESMACVDACLHEALKKAGRTVTVNELMRILQRDQGFWGDEGGVTFTGGEPLLHQEFLLAVLKKCRNQYIHTVIETCAQVDTAVLLEIQQWTDWLFIDLKHMDSEMHRQGTGVGNEQILKNIEATASQGRIVLRMPVIPGYNDAPENARQTAEFMKRVGLQEINLLPFHRLGQSKYEQLGLPYEYGEHSPPSSAQIADAAAIFASRGISCYVGSETPF